MDSNTKPDIQQDKEESYLNAYIKTFDEKELQAYNIAKDHLGMSFDLKKSIGYIKWKKDNLT